MSVYGSALYGEAPYGGDSSSLAAITGTVAYTNNNDTVAATGTSIIVGTVAKTNNNDTCSAAASAIANGTVNYTNKNDTSNAIGYPVAVGTVAYTNINDVCVAVGHVTGAITLTAQDLLNVADAVWSHSSAIHCQTLLTEVWGRLGLDISAPLISGTTQISFGAIVMAMTELAGTVTVTRQ
jgi:hypothetical protein